MVADYAITMKETLALDTRCTAALGASGLAAIDVGPGEAPGS
jgi:hypothetical protein